MKLETKQDFTDLMFRVLDPLKPLYSEGKARLHLGETGVTFDQTSMEMEAFSRPLWGLVPFWAGGGNQKEFEEIYQQGLKNGTNPEKKEYWDGFHDYDQRFVEMAAISCGILMVPEKLWNPLSEEEKQNLADWLEQINHYIVPDCNWQFFRALVNLALKKAAKTYSEDKLQESLTKLDSYYVGDGWYRDGASNQKDYYIPFAMHYYGLLYSILMEKEDPERCRAYRERAKLFAKDFIYWFAEDGAALPYGRSLPYRWAQNAFWSACVYAEIEPFSLAVMKGIIVRHFEWWLAHPIFDRDGVLTIGYGYPNLIMAERYISPGSPYWGMKSFLILALPEDHPFWKVKAAPLPELDPIRPLYRADMLMHRLENDVVSYPAGVCEKYGHGHVPEKYAKFAYSTSFGFSCARSSLVLNEAAPDSMLSFVIDDTVFVRKYSTKWEVREDSVYAEWSPFPGISVKTTVKAMAKGHTRHHEITSEFDCEADDMGFSIPRFEEEGYEDNESDLEAFARTKKHCCVVSGKGPMAHPFVLYADPNTNVDFKNTSIPGVRYQIKKGVTILDTVVTAVCLV